MRDRNGNGSRARETLGCGCVAPLVLAPFLLFACSHGAEEGSDAVGRLSQAQTLTVLPRAVWHGSGIHNSVGRYTVDDVETLSGLGVPPVDLAVGDTDGDGTAELVLATSTALGSGVSFWSSDFLLLNPSPYPAVLPAGQHPRVALGDLIDGEAAEFVAANGAFGEAGDVRVFSSADGDVTDSFFSVEPGFYGGDEIAICDLNNDGKGEIVIAGTWEIHSASFDVHFTQPGQPSDYFAGRFPLYTRGSSRMTCADLDGDGRDEIIFGTHFGDPGDAGPCLDIISYPGYPQVVYPGPTQDYCVRLTMSADIAAGDLDGDGYAEIVTGYPGTLEVWNHVERPFADPDAFDLVGLAPYSAGDPIAITTSLGCEVGSTVDCVANVPTCGGDIPGKRVCNGAGSFGPCQSLQELDPSIVEVWNELDDDCDGFTNECTGMQYDWNCSVELGGCGEVAGSGACFSPGGDDACILGCNRPASDPHCPGAPGVWVCDGSTLTCQTGVDDNCNGADEDCNGIADDAYVPTTMACPGFESCATTTNACVDGTPVSDPPCPVPGPCSLPGDHPTCPGAPGTITSCSVGAGACVPDDAGAPELPNGIDDNCDGIGLGDEFCDGEDNDGDGRYDEDQGSCLMRLLLVPLCWQGTDETFEDAVASQRATFLDALGLAACQQTIAFVGIPPSTLNALGPSCSGGMLTEYFQEVEAAVEALGDERYALLDFDAVAGLTDIDLEGSTRGATDRSGRFWAETFDVPFPGVVSRAGLVTVHEFGHVVDLDDEYCSTVQEPTGSVAAAACNKPTSVNAMSAAFGCDPALESCCDVDFRHPGYLSEYPNDASPCGGEYHICCLGNSAVQDASLPLASLTNDPAGRCAMASSISSDPRRFCQACLTHVRNTTPYECGNTFAGTQRILEVEAVAAPGVKPLLVSYRSGVDGRVGWQAYSHPRAGDALLRFVVRSTAYELATRPFPMPSSSGEERVSAERLLRIPLPDDVADDEPITVFVEVDGTVTTQITLNGEPPVPAVEGQVVECEAPIGTQVMLDGSASSDPDGDPITFAWEAENGVELSGADTANPVGVFPVGDTDVTLTVTDTSGLAASVTVTVTVEDTIPPVFAAATPLTLQATTCGLDADDVSIVVPEATDACAEVVTVTGVISGSAEVGPEDAMVSLSLGSHSIEWTADDGYNETPLTQSLTLSPAFFATRNLDIRDRARVLAQDQTGALVVNRGTSLSRLGSAPGLVGTLLSRAKVESYGGTIDGDVRTQSTYQGWNGAQVTGLVYQWQSVPLPAAPSTPVVNHGSQDVIVNSGTRVLAPGNYRDLIVNSGWPSPTVVLSAGTYNFRSLTSNSASAIRVSDGSNPLIRVKTSLNYRGGFVEPDGDAAKVRLAFAGTNAVLEGPFIGTFVAPASSVELGMNAQSEIAGQFVARDLLVRPDVTVTCMPSASVGNTFTF